MLSEWWNLSSPEAPELYCCYHTHTHTKVKRTLSKLRHTQTILLHELILYISWYVWYCGVHVVSCYDAVWGGGGVSLDFWVGQRRFSISATVASSLSLLPLCVFVGGDVPSVTLSRLARDWKVGKQNADLLELITSTFLTLLCPCCRLNPDSFLLRQFDMCLVLADSHVYIKCIYVYTCAIHAIWAIYYCDYYWWWYLSLLGGFSPFFFFSSWFPVDDLCCEA